MDALERTHEHVTDNVADEFLAATIRGMMTAYDARWRDAHDAIDVWHIEREWEATLVNLRGKRMSTSRTFGLGGKVDKVGEGENGRVTIWDHKTSALDIRDPDAPYWRQLSVEGQPSHYELILHQNGIRVDDVVWDVVRKPTIRPKAIAKKDVAALASLGTYCGRKFETFATHHDGIEVFEGMRETPKLYEARVAQTMTDDHDKYFQRRSFKRTREELIEYADELWQIGQEITTARREGRWYRNSGACMLYGTPCQFLGICSGFDTPDSDKWVRKDNVHEELEGNGGDGRDVLTNSRVRCFQTCRRKHFYQYELGIKRADEEEREPLRFGSAWHDALDVYWAALDEAKYDGDDEDTRTPVNAAGGREEDASRLPR